jgi:tetratricopeptide (TPR) repeat protein/tRNA A-37 threonylcarbamoyl transferase component Bud32
MPDLIGQTLGGYRILSQIGKGGMATVYKAFQPSLDRYVAIKVLPPYYAAQDETFLKRFRQEARAVARLRHPNILMVLDYGEQDGTTYIVMEYVEAGTLTDRLGRIMSLAEVTPLIQQVASALDYAHEQGVIHRDVKPSNILLPKPDWPLLTDFGLAKIVGATHLTQSGTVAGTPAYMSPEQGRGDPLDARTDIYSLGIVLYEMVTGDVPFSAETPMAVIVKHIIEPLPLPRARNPDLPEPVERVVLKALAKDPRDRYATAGEMARALTVAVETAPALATTTDRLAPAAPAIPTTAEPVEARAAPRRSRLGRWVLAGAGSLVVLAALIVGILRMAQPLARETPEAAGPHPIEIGPGAPTRTVDQLMADGQAMLGQGDIAAAMADFEAAMAADPGNHERLWEIASLLKDYGHAGEARSYLDRAVAAGPDDASFHDAAGWFYNDLGLAEEARAQFQRSLELDPDALGSYLGLSEAAHALGDTRQAQQALDAIMAHPRVSDPGIYEGAGWGYLDIEDWPDAQAAFREALSLDPANPNAWNGLAEATYQSQGLEQAMSVVQEGIAANPQDASLYEKAGWYAWEAGDVLGAEATFRRAVEVDPSYTSGYTALASLLSDLERGEEAFTLLVSAIQANPEDPWLHEALAGILQQRGQDEEAFTHLQRAMELDPSSGWLALEAAQAYYAFSGDARQATALLEQAVGLEPNDPNLALSVGEIYEQMGDCRTALSYFERALEIDPGLDEARQGQARCSG